jgi:hypothetical protein
MTDPDPAAAYAALRAETAGMLKLDAANLSLVEGLQLDLVSLLRLEVDGLQGAVLSGDQVDLARLSTALAMLQKLLPTQLAPAAATDQHDFSGAREELARHFDRLAEAHERRLAMFPQRSRDEFEAKLQAAVEKYPDVSNPGDAKVNAAVLDASSTRKPTAGEDARSDDSVPPSSEALAGGGGETTPQPPQPVPSRVKSEAELIEQMDRANSTPPPGHYLKREPSPWSVPRDAYSIRDDWSPKW